MQMQAAGYMMGPDGQAIYVGGEEMMTQEQMAAMAASQEDLAYTGNEIEDAKAKKLVPPSGIVDTWQKKQQLNRRINRQTTTLRWRATSIIIAAEPEMQSTRGKAASARR